jgi:hypothetical protein
MRLDLALAMVCRSAPEIISATWFVAHRLYPDFHFGEDLLAQLGFTLGPDPAKHLLLEDLVVFHQAKKDFDAALTICVTGYCILLAVKPFRGAGLGILAWLIGWVVAQCCFPGSDLKTRYRHRRAIPYLLGAVELVSVAAKLAL